jgi:murein DD-endopeptidase MepM/ murein hydrolase activator NlpD
LTNPILRRAHAALERRLPDQRLFLRSENGTRFIQLKPMTQALMIGCSSIILAWSIIASAVLLIDSIGSGNAKEQARLSYLAFEDRLDDLSAERDMRAAEAAAAQERFTLALAQVSHMQSSLLASEERRRELETGIGLIQTTLRTAMKERDAALGEVAAISVQDAATTGKAGTHKDVTETLAIITDALQRTASERDASYADATAARNEADEVVLEMRLLEERHDEIFSQLEDAVTVSMEPLDKVFSAVGLDANTLINEVRRGYSGQGGPLGPITPLTAPDAADAPARADYDRAGRILDGLDRVNLYRMAIEKTPLAMPLKTSYRFTSGFGRRWGRMHEGLDLAGGYGSPIYTTADGVVTHAGWKSGYGNLVEVRHAFGLTTRYRHMSAIKVTVGQKISRGDRIGDMGNTGRSTGTHLHYEVRIDGKAVNPMSFIKAATNVF